MCNGIDEEPLITVSARKTVSCDVNYGIRFTKVGPREKKTDSNFPCRTLNALKESLEVERIVCMYGSDKKYMKSEVVVRFPPHTKPLHEFGELAINNCMNVENVFPKNRLVFRIPQTSFKLEYKLFFSR